MIAKCTSSEPQEWLAPVLRGREALAEVARRKTPCGIVTSLSGKIVEPLLPPSSLRSISQSLHHIHLLRDEANGGTVQAYPSCKKMLGPTVLTRGVDVLKKPLTLRVSEAQGETDAV